MKLHFAFGNPRTKKKAKKSEVTKKAWKKVAKKSKSVKTKSVAKKTVRKKVAKVAKKTTKKNPRWYTAKKKGAKTIVGKKVPTRKEAAKLQGLFEKAWHQYEGYAGTDAKKAKLRQTVVKANRKLENALRQTMDEDKMANYYKSHGYDMEYFDTDAGGKGVAKKKKTTKKKSVAKKKTAKKVTTKKKATAKKSVAKKAVAKKVVRKKATKKRVTRKVARKAVAKKATRRKVTRRKATKRVTHSHSSATRHLKKGSKLKVNAVGKYGKRRVKMTGYLKVNPRKGNPIMKIDKALENYTGMDATQLISIALGGALVPTINVMAAKIPGVDTAVAKLNETFGPQAAGSIIPVALGIGATALGENVIKGASAKKYAKSVGQGLVAAGVIGLTMSLASKMLAQAGLAGVNYTPMSGVNYTPMSGVNYTPMQGVPQLGNRPDFGASADYGQGGGYTENSRFSSADFGGMSMDAGYDEDITEDDIMDDTMLGGMG